MKRREFIKKTILASIGMPLLTQNSFGQKLENLVLKHSMEIKGTDLLTTPVFDGKYNSIEKNDEYIAQNLFKNNLQEAVNKKIITKEMLDLALPLGIWNKKTSDVDYVQGMKDMWNNKKGITWKGKQGNILRAKRDYFIKRIKTNNEKTTIRKYRSNEIAKGCQIIKEIFEAKKKYYSSSKNRAMKEIIENIKPNILLAYNIQELIPPGWKGKQINPVFKAYFLNQLLKEAGKTFIEGYPARYDIYMSYGPFQLTKFAMPEIIKYNRYLSQKDKIPQTTGELKGLQEHVNSAAILAYSNWEKLIGKFSKYGILNKFNKKFPGVSKTKKETFIAGVTACMHHLPSSTMKKTCYFIDNGDYNKINYDIRKTSFSGNPQLQKYYDSSAEAYLLLKVFHILDEKYTK